MRWIVAWAPLVLVMIVNGVVREKWFRPRMPELRAHQLSTLTGGLLYGAYVWLVFDWLRVASANAAWGVGLSWFALTVVFEFGFGRYVAGHSWSRLLADYDLTAGRVWALLLVWIAVGPRIVFELRSTVLTA